jgi:hypothetical protein
MIEGYGQTESPCGIMFSRAAASTLAAMHELSVNVCLLSLQCKLDWLIFLR